jgi:replicative DNA helicase
MDYLEPEKWVIGSLLIDPQNIDQLRNLISAGDFFNPIHSKIFSVIEEISDREDMPLDLSTIYSCLKETAGDELKIAKLLEQDIPTDVNLKYWAKLVRKQSLERKLKERMAEEGDIPLNEIEEIIYDLKNLNIDTPLYRAIDKIPPMPEGIQIKTGFTDIDKNLRFGPGNLMVIAGKTGMGKTSLGLGIIHHICKEKPIGVITVEMTGEEVRERVSNSFGILPDNIWVADPPALSTLELKHIYKSMQAEQNIEVILIDYLQLMREREDFRSRHLEISHIIRKIKEIAKELQIATIVVSSLGRGIDHRGEGSLPSLSDLKESGDIEFAADSVLFIHQPQKGDDDYRGENVRLIIIAKNRWGFIGKLKLFWIGEQTKFGNFQEG